MDKELKAAWIADLRSGNFKQGRGRLAHAGHYCCLGVLAKRCGCHLGLEEARLGDRWVGDAGNLSENFWHELNVGCGQDTFTYFNDGEGARHRHSKTFAEIADWIETHIIAE